MTTNEELAGQLEALLDKRNVSDIDIRCFVVANDETILAALRAQPAQAGEMADGLLPCPFCGGDAKVSKRANAGATADWCGDHQWWVHCEADGDCAGQLGLSDTEVEAIAAWNTRAPQPQPASADVAGLVEQLKVVAKSQTWKLAEDAIREAIERLTSQPPAPTIEPSTMVQPDQQADAVEAVAKGMVPSAWEPFHPAKHGSTPNYKSAQKMWLGKAKDALAAYEPTVQRRIAEAVAQERRECADAGYVTCAKTRHVNLGDQVRNAILARGVE